MYKFKTKTIDIVYAFSTWITVFCVLVIFMYFIKPDFFKGENTNQHQQKVKEELSHTFQDTVKREAVICYSDSGEAVKLGRNEVDISMNGKQIGGYMVSLNPTGSSVGVGLRCLSKNSNITYFQQDTVSLIDRSKPDIYKLEERISRLESKIGDLEFQERINRGR